MVASCFGFWDRDYNTRQSLPLTVVPKYCVVPWFPLSRRADVLAGTATANSLSIVLEGTTVGSSDVDQIGEDDVFTPGKTGVSVPVSGPSRGGGGMWAEGKVGME